MARWGMVIDLECCTACSACVVACQMENNVPVASQEHIDRGLAISWLTVATVEHGEFPEQRTRFQPMPCMHCDHAPCTKVCPVGATSMNEEGLVGQVYDRCIGCRYCANNCPYTVKYFNWSRPSWPKELERSLNPDVTIRSQGVVEKCSFCHQRLQKAREQARAERRELREGEYVPACVQSCPTRAMAFGDLDDPASEVSQLRRTTRAFQLLEDLGTEPKVFYLSEEG